MDNIESTNNASELSLKILLSTIEIMFLFIIIFIVLILSLLKRSKGESLEILYKDWVWRLNCIRLRHLILLSH